MSRAPTRRAAAAGLAAGLLSGGARAAAPAPKRIVSLNPCLDVILVHLADRAQIVALSHWSHDPETSSLGPVGRTFPYTYESAEEVVALRPDLVLTGGHSSAASRAALARLGVRTALFAAPDTVEESLAQVAEVARAVGRPQRGDALVARIRAAIARAAPPPGERRLTVLVYQSGGFAAAKGALMDDMLTRAGFDNAATRYGLKRTGDVPLERVIADPPDVLLAGEPRPGAPNWADRVLTHPALSHVRGRMHRAVFPQRLTFCGGPVLIETAAMLARVRREALQALA
ncbi:ABC transporter substrate-binding protein [Phenylobacterium sp.]|uniref:ABC transporter substrate-binding protein n=1 Tax=Phenylobacterium sp. TaxID=1871053 RepID=UPI002F3E332F